MIRFLEDILDALKRDGVSENQEAFADGQELLILVTELTVRYYCAKFVSKFGCDAYFRHNQNLMFYQRKQELLTEIAALEEL